MQDQSNIMHVKSDALTAVRKTMLSSGVWRRVDS
jgi:hypothetical protein